MDKKELPSIMAGMPLDQAMFLELYQILVDAKILTEEEAIKIYEDRKYRFSKVTGIGNWQNYE